MLLRLRALVLSLVGSFVLAGVALAGELYVSPEGDDAHPGSKDQPLRTLIRARDLARQQQGDITIWLQAGIYWLDAPLHLDTQHSADDGATITYAAAPGAEVVISGGQPISGWRQEGDLLVADVQGIADPGSLRELFIGGERRPRARHPNEGYLRVEKAGPDNRTSFTYREGDVPSIAAPHRAEVVFLHDWSTSRIRIQEVDRENRVLRFANPIGPGAPHYAISHFEPHPRYYLENAREFLDSPGEWFLDAEVGKLYYHPREGESADNLQAVVPRLTNLITVQGDASTGTPVRGLRFRGLTFAYCRWDIPRGGYAAGQATFHEDRDSGAARPLRGLVPAAIRFELAEDCALEDCRLEHLGGAGVSFGRQCHGNRVSRCTLRDIAGNGILIGETFTRTAADGTEQVCRGNEVTDCVIEHCGVLYYGAVGVWVGIARNTTIAHNEIRHLPYTGVSVGWQWNTRPTGCRENAVRDNHIHHVMQILSDGGGIYTLGRQPGAVLAGNRIHDVPLNAGRAESNGMFIDEGSSLITIENNTIYNIDRSPIRFHRAERNTVRNNRLVCAPGVPPFRYNNSDPNTMTMENNQVIEAANWTPPDDDPTIKAGVR